MKEYVRSFSRYLLAAACGLLVLLCFAHPARADGLWKYNVSVAFEVTNGAAGWNSASMTIHYKKDNGTGNSERVVEDILDNINGEKTISIYSDYFDGFPTSIDLYTDFGGGFNWREFQADVTVFVNDINVASKHITAKSAPFSSADATNTITIDESIYPYAKNIESDIPARVEGDVNGSPTKAYFETQTKITDQYNVRWTAKDMVDFTEEGGDYGMILSQIYAYAGEYGLKYYTDVAEDQTLKAKLHVKSANSLYKEVTKDFETQVVFPRTLRIVAEGVDETVTGLNGDRYEVKPPAAEKEGFSLDRWTLTGGGAFLPDENGGGVYVFGTQDGVLEAQYKLNTYMVCLHANNGTDKTKTMAYNFDKTYALPVSPFTWTGHTMGGWNSEPDGSGQAFAPTAKITNLTTEKNATVDLWAQWTTKTYNVTFVNKITGEKTVLTAEYGGTVEAPEFAPVPTDDKEHSVFLRWNKSFATIKSNTTVTAVFTQEEHSFEEQNDGSRICRICGYGVAAADDGLAETGSAIGPGSLAVLVIGLLAAAAIAVFAVFAVRKRGAGKDNGSAGFIRVKMLLAFAVLCGAALLVPAAVRAEDHVVKVYRLDGTLESEERFAEGILAWNKSYNSCNSNSKVELILGSNWQEDVELTLHTEADLTIDLNGYSLVRTRGGVQVEKGYIFRVPSGSALTIKDSNPNSSGYLGVRGGVITGGANTDGAGAIHLEERSRCTITGGTIYGCTTNYHGGAVLVNKGATFQMTGGRLYFCQTVGAASNCHGGGIYANGGKVILENAKIDYCYSEDNGGAVYVNDGELLVRDFRFIGNHCLDDGGGIFVSGGSLNMDNGWFSSNEANGNGGALYVDNDDGSQIRESIFRNNRSGKDGGGIYVNDDRCFLLDCEITGNKATGHGGGVYVDSMDDIGIAGRMIIADNSGRDSCNNLTLQEGGASKALMYDGGLTEGSRVYLASTGSHVTLSPEVSAYQLMNYLFPDKGPLSLTDEHEVEAPMLASVFGTGAWTRLAVIALGAAALALAAVALYRRRARVEK